MTNEVQIDAHPPAKMASRMEEMGVTKAGLKAETMFALAMLAGAFVGCGANFATWVTTGLVAASVGHGLIKLLRGLVFCLGFVAVIVAGAELSTGNNLIIIASANGRLPLSALLRHWAIVYPGNFVGSILAFLAMFLTRQHTFVAAGLEYNVANMYFIPIGLFIKSLAGNDFWAAIGKTAADYGHLTWGAFFLKNLLPVTVGNIIGGVGFVGLAHRFIQNGP